MIAGPPTDCLCQILSHKKPQQALPILKPGPLSGVLFCVYTLRVQGATSWARIKSAFGKHEKGCAACWIRCKQAMRWWCYVGGSRSEGSSDPSERLPPSRLEPLSSLDQNSRKTIERVRSGSSSGQPLLTYIDTSVLAAYYCPEPLSGQAQQALREEMQRAISWLVETEMVSVIARKVRTRELRPAEGRRVLALFQSHLDQGSYTRLALEGAHFAKAREWLAAFTIPLHTLDALHVAVAALQDCPLLTADTALAEACVKIGVTAHLIR